MLFLEKDIDRLMMLAEDDHQSFWARLKARFRAWHENRQEDADDEEADAEQAEAEPETAE